MKNNISPLEYLTDGVTKRPEAVLLYENGKAWTWRKFYDESMRVASLLKAAGIERGDRVAYLTKSDAEGFLLLFGVWLAGGVASPVNGSVPLHSVENMVKTLNPRFLLYGKEISNPVPLSYSVQSVHNKGDGGVIVEPYIPDPDATALILFTSGSTGLPKGVVSTHRALALNACRMADVLRLSHSDRLMINTPHYYTSAICHLFTLMCGGGGLVVKKGFLFWETFVEEIERHSCTGFGGAPTHFVRLFSGEQKVTPKTLRFLMSSGDHLPDNIAYKALRAMPHVQVFRVYGLSEVSGRLCVLKPGQIGVKPDCAGLPLPGMIVRILREDNTGANAGELGEIHVSGDMLTHEYFNNKKASIDLHTEWGFRTGDIGYVDEDGYVYLQGRKDDVFKSGGEKVSCIMIQQELLNLGDFTDVAVVPIEDEFIGKIPKAYLVMAKGVNYDKNKIIRSLRKILPQNHIPKRYKVVSTIPRTGSGKIIRNKLSLI